MCSENIYQEKQPPPLTKKNITVVLSIAGVNETEF
jgi:hypothetical protein